MECIRCVLLLDSEGNRFFLLLQEFSIPLNILAIHEIPYLPEENNMHMGVIFHSNYPNLNSM